MNNPHVHEGRRMPSTASMSMNIMQLFYGQGDSVLPAYCAPGRPVGGSNLSSASLSAGDQTGRLFVSFVRLTLSGPARIFFPEDLSAGYALQLDSFMLHAVRRTPDNGISE